jgi:hypothetical protein
VGIQFNLDRLVRDAKTLDLTYTAWANESDDVRRARMEGNIEFLIYMMGGYLKAARGDWREAFPDHTKAMIYDDKLQSEIERQSNEK